MVNVVSVARNYRVEAMKWTPCRKLQKSMAPIGSSAPTHPGHSSPVRATFSCWVRFRRLA